MTKMKNEKGWGYIIFLFVIIVGSLYFSFWVINVIKEERNHPPVIKSIELCENVVYSGYYIAIREPESQSGGRNFEGLTKEEYEDMIEYAFDENITKFRIFPELDCKF